MASAAIVDAQSVKGADTVGALSRGFDAGKKVNGGKRHIIVDTSGLLLLVMVTAASVQDRDGGARALERLRFVMPSVATVWADGGYAGRLVAYAAKVLQVVVTIVRKQDGQVGFVEVALPRQLSALISRKSRSSTRRRKLALPLGARRRDRCV